MSWIRANELAAYTSNPAHPSHGVGAFLKQMRLVNPDEPKPALMLSRSAKCVGAKHMKLLVTYILIVSGAVFGIASLCVLAEKWTSPFTSLLMFFVLFFTTIWASWLLSVWITRPKPIS